MGEIIQWYHSLRDEFTLTDKQMNDVMEYITAHRDQVEQNIKRLPQAEENRRYWETRNRERFEHIAHTPPPGQEQLRANYKPSRHGSAWREDNAC